ncbi:hypothetical protein FHS24_000755 [Psychrobacter luti]|uniref:Uncharacterized protein n=1 Tax=Psychrobacter luti TaxID=198481 RepID=A0A839TDX9_9GAMM|nr:hypothetical protein [Psychrobacter luti]
MRNKHALSFTLCLLFVCHYWLLLPHLAIDNNEINVAF